MHIAQLSFEFCVERRKKKTSHLPPFLFGSRDPFLNVWRLFTSNYEFQQKAGCQICAQWPLCGWHQWEYTADAICMAWALCMAECSSCSFTCTLRHIKLASTICKEDLLSWTTVFWTLFSWICIEEKKICSVTSPWKLQCETFMQ